MASTSIILFVITEIVVSATFDDSRERARITVRDAHAIFSFCQSDNSFAFADVVKLLVLTVPIIHMFCLPSLAQKHAKLELYGTELFINRPLAGLLQSSQEPVLEMCLDFDPLDWGCNRVAVALEPDHCTGFLAEVHIDRLFDVVEETTDTVTDEGEVEIRSVKNCMLIAVCSKIEVCRSCGNVRIAESEDWRRCGQA